jgi:FkbH-like protein
MWEFEQYDKGLYQSSPVPKVVPKPLENFKTGIIRAASLVLWTEHCSECTYPSCYATCDLYEPRFDLHCRTLKFGIKKTPCFSSIRPYSSLVVAKEWATLDAIINLSQIPFAALRYIESGNYIAAHLFKIASSIFFSVSSKKKLLRGFGALRTILIDAMQNSPNRMPDAFLLQVYNGSESQIHLSLKFTNFPRERDSILFQKRFLLKPGINEFVLPFAEISSYLDPKGHIRAYMSFQGKNEPILFFAAADFVVFQEGTYHQLQEPQDEKAPPKIKCLVWDLDNTIWKGILLEHPEGVEVNKGVTNLLKTLDKRGIVHAIASKNNFEDATAMLEQLGIYEYFVYPQISWRPKSEGIAKIVQKLNIGMDTIAFIDDSEFELKEVNARLPEVTTINSEGMASITDDPRFGGSTSSDSSKRRYFYKAEESRQHVHEAFSGSYEDFLLSCHMTIEARHPRQDDLERLHELVQRTNQLNFTGNRYRREDLTKLIHSPELDCFLVACNDDFGDYGTVGFCIIERGDSEVTVKELAISCRVLGKRVEQMFFKNMMEIYNKQGKHTLWLVYRNTGKNIPSMRVIEDIGFELFSEEDGKFLYRISMANYVDLVDTATVIISMEQ